MEQSLHDHALKLLTRNLLRFLVLILISGCGLQYQAEINTEPRELTVYTEYNTQETLEIMNGIDVKIVSIKKYRGRNSSHKAIMNDMMALPDTGKILVLINKNMWHCLILPCIFGATETIHWDRAYATGHFSAAHEVNHLFGARDIL